MTDLILEYVLDGRRPGYAFRPPTNSFSQATLDAVWRGAMPRGQGWGDESLHGALSLKTFRVGEQWMALSRVTVTDQADELGRRGIRRAEIDLVPRAAYQARLHDQLDALPAEARLAASERLGNYLWKRILDKALLRAPRQVVLAHPYASVTAWQVVEALILHIVTSPGLQLLEGWGPLTTFTTLARDWHEESQVIGLPHHVAARSGAAAIRIP